MLITHIQLERIICIIVNDVHAIYMCDLSVMLVVCPLVLREGCQGKACLCVCSLSPGVESRVPWGMLVLLCFCHCVVCLAVKQGEPP